MLVNNVQESSTTAGTGNFTLDGSSENGRTFSSQFETLSRFAYVIDDGLGNFETGVGYLSNSTTLVRELPQDGSSALPVNFGVGTKQVFVGASSFNLVSNSTGFSDLSSTIKFMTPSNFVRTSTTTGLSADRIDYIPIYISRPVIIDQLAVRVTTGAGTSSNLMHLGIYDVNPSTGLPQTLMASTTNLDPSVAATVSGTITELNLVSGWYWGAIWCDTTPSVRANDSLSVMSNPFSITNNSNLTNNAFLFVTGQAGLTDLPQTANPAGAITATVATPVLLVGKT